MENNFPINVLESKPKDFVISLNNGVGGGDSFQDIPVIDTTPQIEPLSLTRPTGFKATTGNNYIFLIWDQDENSDIKGYNLYYSTTSGRYIQRRPVGNVNQYELDTLENGKTYYLAITAYDYLDRETDYSDEVRITVGDSSSSSAPILISREDYLQKVPAQPENGPHIFLLITLISIAAGAGFVVIHRQYS